MDLFAGCGGLSLGLEEAGVRVLWANERDKHAAATYGNTHPQTKLFTEDVGTFFERVIAGESGLPQRGDVDLIAGGPPCQGFSGYNRYRNTDDPRNSLVEVFLNFVGHLQPQFVLIENVPGMLSLDGGKVPRLLMRVLGEMGYTNRLGILQAGYYGLPQNRWRVFLWAARGSQALPSFPEPSHLFPRTTIFGATAFRNSVVKPIGEERNLFWEPQATVTVGDAISDLPSVPNGGGVDETTYDSPPETAYQRAMRRGSPLLWNHRCARLGVLMHARCCAVPKRPGAGWLDLPQHLKPQNLLRHGDKRYDNRFGRLYWAGTFNTILTRAYPYWSAVFHPDQDRVITARESARAQGFPDAVRFVGGTSSVYQQIGNAVPPLLAKKLGEELMRVLNGQCVQEGD